MRSLRLGQVFFAIASASLAVWSIGYRHFAWQSVPGWVPWQAAWIYGSGLILLAASVGLCLTRTAQASALVIGAYLAIVAVLSVPLIFAQPLGITAWYPFCEAVTSLVGVWLIYILLHRESRASATAFTGDGAVYTAQILFGLTCVFYGWSHFVYADYTASMVPAWLPGHMVLAYFTGAGHIAAGAAIIAGILPGLAATLEAAMMSLFGLLVWVPSFFAQPRPTWAAVPENQRSELVVNLLLAAAAWMVAISIWKRLRGAARPPLGS
ncbi:MAG TPA: hypothetical protein VGG63_15845 [Steroidobacteraceae bacterium]|jgi:uncharacterized membrane protein